MQRDRERVFHLILRLVPGLVPALLAHSARSRKWPALAETSCSGAPSRITISPGVQVGAAQRLAELRYAGAQLIRGRRSLGPHPHRSAIAAQRDQRMHGTAGSTSSVKRARHILLAASTSGVALSARNLELRHRRALLRHERNFKVPARRHGIDPAGDGINLVRQRGDLQQRLPRDGAVGVGEQMAHGALQRRIRHQRGGHHRLRRRQRAADRRRRHVGAGKFRIVDIGKFCSGHHRQQRQHQAVVEHQPRLISCCKRARQRDWPAPPPAAASARRRWPRRAPPHRPAWSRASLRLRRH